MNNPVNALPRPETARSLSPLAQVMQDLEFTLCGPWLYRNPCSDGEFTIEQQLLKPFTKLKGVKLQFTKDNAAAQQINGRRLFGVNLIARVLSDNAGLNTHFNLFYFGGTNRSAGPGHGLAITNQHGQLIYYRNPGYDQQPESGWLIPKPQRGTVAA